MSKTLKLQVLITARALIAEKKHWTHEAFARDKHGRHVDPIADDAVRFCAVGAIMRAYHVCTGRNELEPPCIPERTLDRLEDISEDKGHSAVLKAFDKLIDEA